MPFFRFVIFVVAFSFFPFYSGQTRKKETLKSGQDIVVCYCETQRQILLYYQKGLLFSEVKTEKQSVFVNSFHPNVRNIS